MVDVPNNPSVTMNQNEHTEEEDSQLIETEEKGVEKLVQGIDAAPVRNTTTFSSNRGDGDRDLTSSSENIGTAFLNAYNDCFFDNYINFGLMNIAKNGLWG